MPIYTVDAIGSDLCEFEAATISTVVVRDWTTFHSSTDPSTNDVLAAYPTTRIRRIEVRS